MTAIDAITSMVVAFPRALMHPMTAAKATMAREIVTK